MERDRGALLQVKAECALQSSFDSSLYQPDLPLMLLEKGLKFKAIYINFNISERNLMDLGNEVKRGFKIHF